MEHPRSSSGEDFLPGYQSLDAYTQVLFEKLIAATKLSHSLPKAGEHKYHMSFPSFKSKTIDSSQRLLNITQNFLSKEAGDKAPIINELDDADEVTEQFDSIVDVIDGLIEKVDTFADEAKGARPKTNIVIGHATSAQGGRDDYHIFHGSNIPRPQLKFEEKIDNSNIPWFPKLKTKYNAMVPFDIDIEAHLNSGMTEATIPHPYEYEIRNFQYVPDQLEPVKEQVFLPLDKTPLTWVQTPEELEKLARTLDRQNEFAVDLEAHNYRSFQGFVCLMQISTRQEDFLVDTLKLRTKMSILNSSFTNPNIVKVLHGSDSDIVWLQRDFGIYVVNMFDTGQASRVLDSPKYSLAYLLYHYCNLVVDKKYQLADWRIRPLPEEMNNYAREDTHYLLYIYDVMKNELISRGNEANNLLLSVLERSRDLCLKKYEIERLNEMSHLTLYNKFNLTFNPQQMRVFAALYAWRDHVARDEDESTRYVLPNHMLFRVAEVMPTTPNELWSCCSPIPNLVKVQTMELLSLISDAKKDIAGGIGSNIPKPVISAGVQSKPAQTLPQTPANSGVQKFIGASPVLTTEQLYHTAGWVTPPEYKNMSGRTAVLSKSVVAARIPSMFTFDNSASEDDDEDDKQAKETASLIRSSLTSELFHIQNFIEPEEKPEQTSDATVIPKDNRSEVPQSISEIYKLSNQIKRKRSKDKAKGKDDDVENGGDEAPEEPKNKRTKGQDKEGNSVDFMKDIGWIDKQDNTQGNAAQGSKKATGQDNRQGNQGNRGHSKSNSFSSKDKYQTPTVVQHAAPSTSNNAASGSGKPQFKSFDYAAAHQAPRDSPAVDQSNVFNPYKNMTDVRQNQNRNSRDGQMRSQQGGNRSHNFSKTKGNQHSRK